MMQICSIYDSLSEFHNAPMYFRTVGEAERFGSNLVNKENESLVFTNPEDFKLVHLGTFDERTGVLTPDYHVINNLSAYKRKE